MQGHANKVYITKNCISFKILCSDKLRRKVLIMHRFTLFIRLLKLIEKYYINKGNYTEYLVDIVFAFLIKY